MIKQFSSIDKEHQLYIDIIEDTAYFTIEIINPEKYKTFLLLLKTIFEYMLNNNVKYVKQYINYNDIENFKNSEIYSERDVIIVKTKIEDFLFELCDALGMNRL